jgi:DNA-binding IclR family transcriptional regulator
VTTSRTAATTAGAVGRALAVLQCLGRSAGPARLAEISRETGLPKSTAHRMLATLEAEGAVRRVHGGFLLGDSIRRLSCGGQQTGRDTLRRLLMPHVAELYEATRLPTSLAVLDELTMVCLVTLYPRALAGPVLRTADRAPAHHTALGRLLLAYRPAATAADPQVPRLEAELARIRQVGVAYHADEQSGGLAGVAVPVTGRPAEVAALGLNGQESELKSAELLYLLRRTAHEARLTLRRHLHGR